MKNIHGTQRTHSRTLGRYGRSVVGVVAACLVLVVMAVMPMTDLAADQDVDPKGEISGKYVAEGKEARLVFARARDRDPWDDQKAYSIILSEIDSLKSKRPEIDGQFGRLGDALILSITQSGELFSARVCHQALDDGGFSSSGSIEVKEVAIEGQTLSAHITSEGPQETFGETWEVDLRVRVLLP